MTTVKVTAEHIIGLLAQKHAQDVFVPECKNGPTHDPIVGLLKLDAWAMPKSWAHWVTIGYEVKVSRHDFDQDQKWRGYLPYCHLFYFVCPGGLIRAADLPRGIGLLWVSQNGQRLQTKLRAEPHEPDPTKLIDLMSYVLMARSRIDADRHTQTEPLDRLRTMRELVEQADKRRELAHFVGEHVQKRFHDMQEQVNDANRLWEQAEEFKLRLAKIGIVWDTSEERWTERYRIDREIDKLVGALDWRELNAIENGAKAAAEFVETVRRLRKEADRRVEVAVEAEGSGA